MHNSVCSHTARSCPLISCPVTSHVTSLDRVIFIYVQKSNVGVRRSVSGWYTLSRARCDRRDVLASSGRSMRPFSSALSLNSSLQYEPAVPRAYKIPRKTSSDDARSICQRVAGRRNTIAITVTVYRRETSDRITSR